MIAQLKTIVLSEEAIKPALSMLVEYPVHLESGVLIQSHNGQKQRHFF